MRSWKKKLWKENVSSRDYMVAFKKWIKRHQQWHLATNCSRQMQQLSEELGHQQCMSPAAFRKNWTQNNANKRLMMRPLLAAIFEKLPNRGSASASGATITCKLPQWTLQYNTSHLGHFWTELNGTEVSMRKRGVLKAWRSAVRSSDVTRKQSRVDLRWQSAGGLAFITRAYLHT